MMRRQNNDWIVWLICGILCILVTTTAILDNIVPYDTNREQTLSKPVFGVEGLTQNGLVNINTADTETLMTVKGIGEVLAERIVTYREEHGGFETVEELLEVKGIGEKTLEKIKRYVDVE